MRILLASFVLDDHTGAELYVRDLARAFRSKGHDVSLYAVLRGRLAKELVDEGFEVLGSLRGVAAPDVIHAQHQPALLAALQGFPATRAVYVIHDANSPLDEPIGLNRVARHIAVDLRCLGRIESSGDHRSELVLNFADMERFAPRAPLPSTPKRALVFSNYSKSPAELAALEAACRSAGVALDFVGKSAGAHSPEPEHLLRDYDVVFAKARAAIEAMAVGNAVILCDFTGLGGLVTSERFDHLRAWNFGGGVLTRETTEASVADALAQFDAGDAARVSGRIRGEASLDQAADQLLDLYAQVLREPIARDSREQRSRLAGHARRWRLVSLVARLQVRARGLGQAGSPWAAWYRAGRAAWRLVGSPGEVSALVPRATDKGRGAS